MINLTNISKIYKTKKTSGVNALTNINLELPNKGLILLVGDSGSGKTSLLNIIGGLDTPTTGMVTFLDQDLIDYSNKKRCLKILDEYKRNYVSFIFQDYNLISELSVMENLKLGLTFLNEENNQLISNALDEVGLAGYENRYPNELSGGEQQRVAIARGLLKDAKLLLADEPTGNLDKRNSLEIIELLKKISLNKLVVVVSHNEELVKQYADGIIKMEDGCIIEKQLEQNTTEEVEKYTTTRSKGISNKIALKMALHNFNLRKLRLFITLLTMLVCYSIISLTIAFLQYNHSYSHYYIVKERDYPVLCLTEVDNYALEYLNKKDIKSVSPPYASSKQQLLDMGFKFYEKEIEFKENCVYISELFIKMLFEGNRKAIINGEEVKLNYNDYELTDIIGNQIWEGETVSGIFIPPYDKRKMDISPEYYDQYYLNRLYGTDTIKYQKNPYDNSSGSIRFSSQVIFNNKVIDWEIKNTGYSGKVLLIEESGLKIYDNKLTINESLQDNEVYISLGMYNFLFKSSYTPNYFIERTENVDSFTYEYKLKNIPNHFGESFSYHITNTYQNKTLKFNNLKIKGIITSDNEFDDEPSEYRETIDFSVKQNEERIKFITVISLWIKTEGVRNLKQILKTLNDDYKVDFNSPVSEMQEEYEQTIENIQVLMKLICIAISIVVILVTMSLISIQIIDRKKEIGILKSMGALNKEIRKIFLFEMLILLIPICIFSALSSYFLIEYINYGMVYNYNQSYRLIAYELINIPYFVIAAFVVNIIATLLPLMKISKLTTVDAIRK